MNNNNDLNKGKNVDNNNTPENKTNQSTGSKKTNDISNEIPEFVFVILRKIKGFLWLNEFILFKIANIAHTLIQLALFVTFIATLFGARDIFNNYFGGFGGGYYNYSPNYFYIVLSYIFIALGIRLFFEIMLIIFSINSKLEEIAKQMKK